MNRKIDNLIPVAIKAVTKAELLEDGKISKEYNGYISSFGAAVMQSGLKPAIAFNESESSGSQKDRKKLMKAVLYIIKQENPNNEDMEDKLLSYVLKNDNLQEKILDAATALKLVIRTFKLKKEGE